MFKRRVEVDLVSLAVIAISHAIIMYGLVEIAYAAGKSVGKIELSNELVREMIFNGENSKTFQYVDTNSHSDIKEFDISSMYPDAVVTK